MVYEEREKGSDGGHFLFAQGFRRRFEHFWDGLLIVRVSFRFLVPSGVLEDHLPGFVVYFVPQVFQQCFIFLDFGLLAGAASIDVLLVQIEEYFDPLDLGEHVDLLDFITEMFIEPLKIRPVINVTKECDDLRKGDQVFVHDVLGDLEPLLDDEIIEHFLAEHLLIELGRVAAKPHSILLQIVHKFEAHREHLKRVPFAQLLFGLDLTKSHQGLDIVLTSTPIEALKYQVKFIQTVAIEQIPGNTC